MNRSACLEETMFKRKNDKVVSAVTRLHIKFKLTTYSFTVVKMMTLT